MSDKFTEKIDKFYLEELGKMLKRQKRSINEEDVDNAEEVKDIDDTSSAPEMEPMDDEEVDPAQEADDILSEVDIDSVSNEGKIELIAAIIDSAQQSSETDEEFSDFMNAILDKVNEFQYEDEEEEGEEDMGSSDEEPAMDSVEDSAPGEEENLA